MDFEQTPAALGFFMPAEWSAHERCWMAWPCHSELWGDESQLLRTRIAFARVARTIAAFEPVTMLARPEHVAEARIACGADVEVLPTALDDSWLRDNGPIFVVDGNDTETRRVAGLDWGFNGWGNKYHGYENDAAVARLVLNHLGMKRFEGPMVLEGGAVHVDGQGTMLTTEDCLLNLNRNPNLDRTQIEQRLALFFGVHKLIWLPNGYDEDETDGHIDNIAAFVSPGRIALNWPADKSDPNYEFMYAAKSALEAQTDAAGRRLEIIEFPQPALERAASGKRLPLSYLNFYLPNGAVVAPMFGCEEDAEAGRLLAALFEDREVIQLDARDIVVGGGGIHCITQQQPKGLRADE